MRRHVRPGIDARVWINSGRWGPKRLRVDQCWAVLKAEDVYTLLLREDRDGLRPDRSGVLSWSVAVRQPLSVEVEVRSNAVWRFGRVFLTCPRCQKRATRIHLPTADSAAACRSCWGLTYESRQLRTYRASSGGRYGGLFSALSYAMCRAAAAREGRAETSAKRQAERRAILAVKSPGSSRR